LVGTINETHPVKISVDTNEVERLSTPSLWLETDIQIQPTRERETEPLIVYSGTTNSFESVAATDSHDWSVIIFDAAKDQVVQIPEAVSPVWFNGGTDVLYAKSNGIYRYNLAADAHERVVDTWTDLPPNTQLAVAPDSSALVMTFPNGGQLVVFKVTDALNVVLTEVGVIGEANTYYFDPVFSPTSNQYVVQKIVRDGADIVESSYVIRDVFSRAPIVTMAQDLNRFDAWSILRWNSVEIPSHFVPLTI
jgi:hypothetical protein